MTVREWRCEGCDRYIGRVEGNTLIEPNKDKSGLPCVRKCPECGTKNILME